MLMPKQPGNLMSKNFPQRGEIYTAQLDPTIGRELKKARPVVIVSNNVMNEVADLVIAVPITAGSHQYFHDIPIEPPEGGIRKKSVIVVEQVRALDKSRLAKKLGHVGDKTMQMIEGAIRDHFGLPEGNILT